MDILGHLRLFGDMTILNRPESPTEREVGEVSRPTHSNDDRTNPCSGLLVPHRLESWRSPLAVVRVDGPLNLIIEA